MAEGGMGDTGRQTKSGSPRHYAEGVQGVGDRRGARTRGQPDPRKRVYLRLDRFTFEANRRTQPIQSHRYPSLEIHGDLHAGFFQTPLQRG